MLTGLRTRFTFPDPAVSVIALFVALGEMLTGLRTRFTFPNLVSVIALIRGAGGPVLCRFAGQQ